MANFAKIKHNIIHGSGPFLLLRSMITSQISSWVDFIVSFVVFSCTGLSAGWAAGIGGAAGGVTNCAVNYRFTFRMRQCSFLAIGVKFFLVWIGSMVLNGVGTQVFTNILMSLQSLNVLTEDVRFTIARLTTALIVSIFWNFLLQRYFVFRTNKFDNFIDRIQYYLSATKFEKRR